MSQLILTDRKPSLKQGYKFSALLLFVEYLHLKQQQEKISSEKLCKTTGYIFVSNNYLKFKIKFIKSKDGNTVHTVGFLFLVSNVMLEVLKLSS